MDLFFEQELTAVAQEVCARHGLPWQEVVGQGLLESGHGEEPCGTFNYFGRKYTDESAATGLFTYSEKWTNEEGGPDAYVEDDEHIYKGDNQWEIVAKFKNYPSLEAAVEDWCLRIKREGPEYTQSTWDPYKEAREALPDRAEFRRLLTKRYGTDSRYLIKLERVMRESNLL